MFLRKCLSVLGVSLFVLGAGPIIAQAQWSNDGVTIYTSDITDNVAIGKTTTGHTLDVLHATSTTKGGIKIGSGSEDAMYLQSPFSSASGFTRMILGANLYWNGGDSLWHYGGNGSNGFSGVLGYGNSGLRFYTKSSSGSSAGTLDNTTLQSTYARMVINENGNIGIGTSTPSTNTKLTISGGSVRADAQPRAKVYATTSQQIANFSTVKLKFDAESYDVGGIHDTGVNTTRLTIPAGGKGLYSIQGRVEITWYPLNPTNVIFEILKNNSTVIYSNTFPANSSYPLNFFEVNTYDEASPGDYYEFTVYSPASNAFYTVADSYPVHTLATIVKVW